MPHRGPRRRTRPPRQIAQQCGARGWRDADRRLPCPQRTAHPRPVSGRLASASCDVPVLSYRAMVALPRRVDKPGDPPTRPPNAALRTVVGVTLRSDPSRRQDRGIADSDGADMADLNDFVLDRLADDERRFEAGELPYIDEAERPGRLRIMRTYDPRSLLLVGGRAQATADGVPAPF